MSRPAVYHTILIALCFPLILLTACGGRIVDSPATSTPIPSPVGPTRALTPTPALPSDTAPTPTEPPFAGNPVEYTVQAGDTLLGIASTYDVPMAAIQLANGMGDSVVVQVGQTLSIPSLGAWEGTSRFWIVYVVQAGDTLVGVAQDFGLSAADIKAVNGLTNADLIGIGQELIIPLDAPAVARAPTPVPTDTPLPTAPPIPTAAPTLVLSTTITIPTASPAPTVPVPTPTMAPVAPPPANVADWSREIAWLINEARAQHGLPPLVYNETLAHVAQAHANDCLQRGWGSHYGSDGSNVKTRMLRAGYDPVRWSECWAHTQSPQNAMDFWMDEVPPNDPHRRTILSTYLTEVGVGVVQPEWGYYFFADFGTPHN
ncbi:MAG: LysM peptidoglycan-binding domain-containing protein [Chloroflexi bacterium]|nr:LysM peptidoglycan-binding domain-containing protein [Chloroflexota bacterium]